MTELLEKNLEVLDQKYPGIRSLIEERREELLRQENLEVLEEENFEGEVILKVRRDGRTLYLGGKRNVRMPAVNQIGLLGKVEYSAPVFMVGMGNVCYLEEVLKVTSRENVIVLYEPSFSIFYKQIQRLSVEELFKNRIIALLVGGINDKDEKALMSKVLGGDRVPIMKNFILPNYEQICLEQVHRFEKKLSEVVNSYGMDKGTARRFSGVLADNIFHNVDYVRTGYKVQQLTAVLPKDVPAVIVSAGPSLNKNIQQLKKLKNKAFIVAVDTAMKPLLKEGIIPDAFAIIDGLKPLELVEMEECRDIPLVTTINAANAVLNYHRGRKFFFAQGYQYVDKIYEINGKAFEALPSGGSVATLAFSFVSYLGYKRVILIGQDLAFTGNKSHADGTFKDKIDTTDTTKYMMVPGNCEELVPTLKNLNNYRIWFENFIEDWKKRYEDFTVINATEGGARIEGTEIMTLEEAIGQECAKEVDISSCINKIKPIFSDEEQKKILEYFHNTPSEFHKISELAKEGENLYKKLNRLCDNKNSDKSAYLKILNKVKKNTKKIEKSPNYELVIESLVVADQILKSAQYLEYQSFEEECKGIAERGMLFTKLLRECALLLEGLAEDTVGKIK